MLPLSLQMLQLLRLISNSAAATWRRQMQLVLLKLHRLLSTAAAARWHHV